MTYATRDMVKIRCGVDLDDATHDVEIDNAIAYGDGYVDSKFAAVGESVPASVPQIVKDASADIAAYYYLRIREPEKAETLFNAGVTLIDHHIDATYRKGVFIRSTKA